jgi:hypothetical protein
VDLITKKLLIQQAERLWPTSPRCGCVRAQFKEQQKIGSNADLEKILGTRG